MRLLSAPWSSRRRVRLLGFGTQRCCPMLRAMKNTAYEARVCMTATGKACPVARAETCGYWFAASDVGYFELARRSETTVADEEHIRRLQQGAEAWNTWRRDILRRGDLSHADLRGANLNEADLHEAYLRGADLGDAYLGGANLRGANLREANLSGAFLSRANLGDANLSGANLSGTNLTGTNLSEANLSGASLIYADLWRANLKGANLTMAKLGETALTGITLADVIGLETCIHRGPSMIDYRTLQKSGPLPIQFLRGVGLPDRLIDYLPLLLDQAIQHYSCSILDHGSGFCRMPSCRPPGQGGAVLVCAP